MLFDTEIGNRNKCEEHYWLLPDAYFVYSAGPLPQYKREA